MTSFTWDNKFNTGIDALDVQNRKIIDYMTMLHNEIVDVRQKCESLNNQFDQLTLLCQMHFMDEERLMDEMNYPLAAEHKRLHDLFLATVDRFKVENNQCHTVGILNDFNNLRGDFITHMLNETLLLSDFIKSRPCGDLAETAYYVTATGATREGGTYQRR
jgi:hemerythrin-like metal-binding protein